MLTDNAYDQVQIQDSNDVFGKIIADITSTQTNLAAHAPYSPERWRLYRDGTRQFPEYGSVTGFTDNADHYLLEPAQGETLTMETTHRPRYHVQYEFKVSFALVLSREMESGDRVRVGPFDGDDGWFFEKNDTHASDEIDLVTIRNGSVVNRGSGELDEPLTTTQTWLGVQTPWYDVGRQLWGQSLSRNGWQHNDIVGRTSIDDGRGPRTGNLPIRCEVQRGSGSSALSMEMGSASVISLGNTESSTRDKEFVKTMNVGTTGSWVPLFAMRTDPDYYMLNAELNRISISQFDGNANIELMARSFHPSNVADANGNQLVDSDFGIPEEVHTQSSVIQTSEAVGQVADSTGTLQASMTEPGGYQLAMSELSTDKKITSNTGATRTRAVIPGKDIVVVMAETSATGNVRWLTTIDEGW